MIDERMMLPIGTLLQDGKYRVVRYMASGGFGNTYEVEHVKLRKRLALKEFFMRGVNLRQGLSVTVSVDDNRATFDQMREKFYKEAQRLAQLDDLHIVEVNDFFEENQTAYYVMRLIDGQSLATALKQSGRPLDESLVQQVFKQVLSALKGVHQQGIYHLDLKPGNIMRNADGHCWLIDFGASKQLSSQESQTLSTSTGLCYTPGYAPSEQISGNVKRIGPWTDFYALGATLYNLLTNQTPPSPDDIMDDGPDAFDFGSRVSPSMSKLILWMMEPRPKMRPQSVDDILGFDDAEEVEPSAPEVSQDTVVASLAPTVVRATPEVREAPAADNHADAVISNLLNNMVTVEGGRYQMGESGLFSLSSHEVTVGRFAIGRYPVTQLEWETIMGENPSVFVGPMRPVENVSWIDCQRFISLLNEATGMDFRLPTAEEWEFAARGGNASMGYKYIGSDDADDVSWYGKNSFDVTHDVGQKLPNELQLYDMGGNVWEWCQSLLYPNGANPNGPRIRRGGGCHSPAREVRPSSSDHLWPDSRFDYLGFRLARSLK